MKRFWTALFAMFALCLALVGCGGSESSPAAGPDPKPDFVGTWEIISMTEAGEETVSEDLQLMKEFGLNVYLELNEDDTCSLELFGEPMNGTWKAIEVNQGSITIDGQDVPMVIKDGELTMEQDGSSLTFVKIDPSQKQDSATLTDVMGDDEDEEQEGSTYFGGDTIEDLDDPTILSIPVVDDELCTIAITAKGMYAGDPGFLFEIVNKSDQDILVMSLNGWTVDGTEADTTLYETVRVGETLGSIMWFNADEVGTDVDALNNIQGQIGIFSADGNVDQIATYDVVI